MSDRITRPEPQSSDRDRLAALVTALLADALSSTERLELNTLLLNHAELREDFVAMITQARLLASRLAPELKAGVGDSHTVAAFSTDDFSTDDFPIDSEDLSAGPPNMSALKSRGRTIVLPSWHRLSTSIWNSSITVTVLLGTVLYGTFSLLIWQISRYDLVVYQDQTVGDSAVGDSAVGDSAAGDSITGDSITGDSPAASESLATPSVATLVKSDRCRWQTPQAPVQVGQKLSPGPLHLLEGTAEILFNDGARVRLFGPVKLQLTSAGSTTLHSGELAAEVPRPAIGFTVTTPTARIVDLGTEFDVAARSDLVTEVEVRKGAVELHSQVNGSAASLPPVTLRAGDARRVEFSVDSQRLTSSELPGGTLSKSGRTSRTPRELLLDLADIVGGGDGRGTGRWQGIDPLTGGIAYEQFEGNQVTSLRAHPVQDNYFVDVVFIPHGFGEQVITGDGHRFRFPANTNGESWDHIWNGRNYRVTKSIAAGVDYALPPHSLIGFHPNKGITFDLAAVRNAYPDYDVTEFFCDAADARMKVQLWVFVDGKLVQYVEAKRPEHAYSLNAIFVPTTKYLTIASTNGGWTFLGDPRLRLIRRPVSREGENEQPPPKTSGKRQDNE